MRLGSSARTTEQLVHRLSVCRRQCGRIPAAGLQDVPNDLALGVVPGELLRELFRPGPELWLAQHPASRRTDCLGGRVVGCQIDAGAGPLDRAAISTLSSA